MSHSEPVSRPATAGAGSAPSPASAAIAAFQSGADRHRAFRTLFERYRRPVERFFARKGVAPEERRDLTQDVFLRIYRELDGFRGEARFETWLYQIASTTYLKSLRRRSTAKRRGREVSVDAFETPPSAFAENPGQLDRLVDDEQRRRLAAAIAELPEQMRHCLTLRLDRGLSNREIALVLRLSPNTVKAHLFQARKRLAARLAPQTDDGREEAPDE